MPSAPLFARLAQPRAIVALILLIWVPLVAYVMFGRALGDLRDFVLLLPSRRRSSSTHWRFGHGGNPG
jgi:hypothetical protein